MTPVEAVGQDVVSQGLVGPGVVQRGGEVDLAIQDDEKGSLEAEMAGLERN